MTATWFAIEKTATGDQPVIYRDFLPTKARITYSLRLDELPNAERWLAMSLSELVAEYEKRRDAGKLPKARTK